MADKQQFTLLAQLCTELEQYHDDYTLKSAAYGQTLADGFATLTQLVADVVLKFPEYADESEVVQQCQQYLEYYTNPPKGALVNEQ